MLRTKIPSKASIIVSVPTVSFRLSSDVLTEISYQKKKKKPANNYRVTTQYFLSLIAGSNEDATSSHGAILMGHNGFGL